MKETPMLSETNRFASNTNTTFKPTELHDFQIADDNAVWAEADSGKFARLREIAEVIAAKQDGAFTDRVTPSTHKRAKRAAAV
jgi:hypothetical protein